MTTTTIDRQRVRDAVDDFLFWLTMKRKRTRQFVPQPQPIYRKGDNTPTVHEWLKAQPEPQLVEQMNVALDINLYTLRTMMTHRPDLFEEAGKVKRGKTYLKLWRAR